MVKKTPHSEHSETINNEPNFTPSTVMNTWENCAPEVEIEFQRRGFGMNPYPAPTASARTFRLNFPAEKIPDHLQYSWITERLLGEPQEDNIQERYEDGWDFVRLSDHPDYIMRELVSKSDNRIRKSNNVLMKKPKEDYYATQNAATEESRRRQQEISFATDQHGASLHDPRFVFENRGGYSPSAPRPVQGAPLGGWR